ncbi:MAG TPA: hypothetical protein VHK47_19365, partial [Polyangia bacterium]|nr:hypothetical protein [Polyangia bacterium]
MFGLRPRLACLVAALASGAGGPAKGATPRFQATDYHDGHSRPRALALDARQPWLYVALSTTDEVAIVDVDPARSPCVVARARVCAFPDALAALPEGGVLVACRHAPGLRHLERAPSGRVRVTALDA